MSNAPADGQLELFPKQNPFDSARRTRGDGMEFWLGRDLMTLLGYDKWELFASLIDRAEASATAQGHVLQSWLGEGLEQNGAAPAADICLSRFACYLVSMNGDPRRPAVAAAQSYFTDQSDRSEPSQLASVRPDLISRSDLARMILSAEDELGVVNAALKSATPAVIYHDRFVISSDVATIRAFGAQFGLSEPSIRTMLLDGKFIYKIPLGERWSGTRQRRETVHEYRAYAKYLDWFDLRPQHNAPRHHNGQVRMTLYVRQEFALNLGIKLGISTNFVSVGDYAA